MNTIQRLSSYLFACGMLLGLTLHTQAQQLYRYVAPDGTVTYSDKPPSTPTTAVTPISPLTGDVVAPSQSYLVDTTALPAAVRKAYSTYPVTFYSTKACGQGCDEARKLLQTRGVPFAEITVNTAKDQSVFQQKVSASGGFPFITIGNKPISGYNPDEWNSYLNAAGYPATSQLPASYRNPAPQPLTEPTPENDNPKPPAVFTPVTSGPANSITDPNAPTINNPAGIRF